MERERRHTWFDRDLTVAGRVFLKVGDKIHQRLVHVRRPILRIPNLAIHLNRDIHESGFNPNKETHMQPYLATEIKSALLGSVSSPASEHHHPLFLRVLAEQLVEDGGLPEGLSGQVEDVLASLVDFELDVCDTQPAAIGGALQEFIFSPRLDNLMSCFLGVRAMTDPDVLAALPGCGAVQVAALFDNEEVGSSSAAGAASSLLKDFFERFSEAAPHFMGTPDVKFDTSASVARSFLLSVDMAHAVHANYPEKHQRLHCPMMHDGVVIKSNANQRYATTAATSLALKQIGDKHGIPVQEFVVRSDMGCGSTIGPILSSNTSVRTVDIGIPQLSMHSIREMCGVDDVEHMFNLLKHFFLDFEEMDASMPQE